MKLSNHTTSVLKNFATINQNLVIKEGNTITTMSAMKNIVAKAKVEETFTKEVAIDDLNEFLAALSLFTNPILKGKLTSKNVPEIKKPIVPNNAIINPIEAALPMAFFIG